MRTESENGREKLNLVTEQLEPRITAEVCYAICVCNWLMMPTKCTLKEDEVSADQFVVPTDKPYPRQKFKFLLAFFQKFIVFPSCFIPLICLLPLQLLLYSVLCSRVSSTLTNEDEGGGISQQQV